MTPGEAIKEHLTRKGWTQADLAAVLGHSRGHVSDVVRDARGISPKLALELAAAFDTEPDYWLRLDSARKLEAAGERAARIKAVPRQPLTPLAAALIENAKLRAALRAFVDDEPCRLYADGGCSRHPGTGPHCDVRRAREVLGLPALEVVYAD